MMSSWSRRMPELPLAGFGFLAHFAWEMMQVPWFAGMLEAPHGTVVWLCTRATLGDVVILLIAFWIASLMVRNRHWMLAAGWRKPLLVMVATGMLITIAFEWLATGPLDRWTYGESMPVVPLIGVGLTPLLQWIILPPLIVWLARRHTAGSGGNGK